MAGAGTKEASKVYLLAHVPGTGRAIAQTADGDAFCLGTVENGATPDLDRFNRITPMVTYEDIARTAMSVLAGDSRALTWPPAMNVLALGFAMLRLQLPDGAPEPTADAMPAEASA